MEIGEVSSVTISSPALLAFIVVIISALQGVIVFESVDPCRISSRKMNILLSLEMIELCLGLASETISFFQLQSSLQNRLQWLHWAAPCLLTAGLLQLVVEVYFTLAVVAKSRVLWIPISSIGQKQHPWELIPFLLTFAASFCLVGWKWSWWWVAEPVSTEIAIQAANEEIALQPNVFGFAVGWTVAVSGMVFIIIFLVDLAEDGPSYFASIPYLWKPDEWILAQEADTKIWNRSGYTGSTLQEYVATAALDAKVEIPDNVEETFDILSKKPLHNGNAIVGNDRELSEREDVSSKYIHKLVLIAEHVIALPLLIISCVIVSRIYNKLDKETFEVVSQLTDNIIIIAFFEIAIGLKNVLWGVGGTAKHERGQPADRQRLEALHKFYVENRVHAQYSDDEGV